MNAKRIQSAPAILVSPDERSASERAERRHYDVFDEFAADSEAFQQGDPDPRMQSWPDDVAGHQHLSRGHRTQVMNVIRVQRITLDSVSMKRLTDTVGNNLF